ncbi:hypothetical protein SAMN05421753_11899 [Planctomicrobium piriforme]|uniref:Transcription factor zinc-finger domain-containing protein n=1 Tax=Planctomicrobium piriforme TaxID=1576369 RepID=A0A1I3QJW0_9PLAN|nr:hypothetical protein SAMN05421753_11899 [Planctomicrobium piriforme]
MQCPRCDGQGIVEKLRVRSTGEILYVCDECEATWLETEKISIDSFRDFTTYMRSIGLKGLLPEIEIITSE